MKLKPLAIEQLVRFNGALPPEPSFELQTSYAFIVCHNQKSNDNK